MSKFKDIIAVIRGELSSKELDELRAYNGELNHVIHDTDQLLFSMSQQPDWKRMRPFFNKLQEGMEYRLKLESKRVGQIVIKEMERTYLP